MGSTIYRVTGIGLAITIALLGAGVSIILYYAGKAAVDLFYTNSMYTDEHNRINRRMPTDDWYGELVLRGWAFGFLYVIPGLSGITASLFFNKWLMGIHIAIAILALVIGSFMHTAGAMALILYRVMVVEGVSRYNPWLGDCIYVRDEAAMPYEYVDEQCLAGRHALLLAIAANSVMLLAWIFVLADLLYIGFTFHNIGKKKLKPVERPRPRRPRNRRNIAHASTEFDTIPKVEIANEESGTTEGTAVVEDSATIMPSETQDVNATNSTVDTTQTTEHGATGSTAVVKDTAPETQYVDTASTKVDTPRTTEHGATGSTAVMKDTAYVVSPETQYVDTASSKVDTPRTTDHGATERTAISDDTTNTAPSETLVFDITGVQVDIVETTETETF